MRRVAGMTARSMLKLKGDLKPNWETAGIIPKWISLE